MSVRNLDALLAPRSVAVIGASNRPGALGGTVMRNMLAAGFAGPIMPVSPTNPSVAGVLTYKDVASLPVTPDLAVICTPPATVPGLIRDLAARGTRAAAVITAGLGQIDQGPEPSIAKKMLDAARPSNLRVLGPNCLGLMVPGVGLNASFAHAQARPGNLAFVSQSGALCTAILDWAAAQGIGFSHFISLGDSQDVDFGDMLDWLANAGETRAILLYIESIRHARKFMSAARAAARNKPVIVVKAGRSEEGARAATSHTGALAGADLVYDAAFRRAGMLRVYETEELFAAVETLARCRPLRGDRLGIVTNGGGPGVMATDALVEGGGRLAVLSSETQRALDAVLPATWSRGNPVDLIGDADATRYRQAIEILQRDPEVDALLVMHVPTAMSRADDVAKATVEAVRSSTVPVLTSWLGRPAVAAARERFAAAGIPTYETPDRAVRAFLHLAQYRANQEMLMETPPSVPEDFRPDAGAARRVIEAALAEERPLLMETEAKALLAAYGIPVVPTRAARTPGEAARIAAELGFPAVLKVLSPDITHKSDAGGVVLGLATAADVQAAAEAMEVRIRERHPDARLAGFSVQPMARTRGARELIAGMSTDGVFGPVILFGAGGTAVEVLRDRALALPPLNHVLARDLVKRTQVHRLLGGYRGHPPADVGALHQALVALSHLVVDHPEIAELDINPLLCSEEGVLALDARVRVVRTPEGRRPPLAIRPYPKHLEETVVLSDGKPLFVRPIRPEDEPAHLEFHRHLTTEDIRFRHFGQVRQPSHHDFARYTQIDYDRDMAFIAVDTATGRTMGVVRVTVDPDMIQAEFAIIVRSDIKGLGLGRLLLEKMIRYCAERGISQIIGRVLPDNRRMLDLARTLGFQDHALPGEDLREVRLSLQPVGNRPRPAPAL